ncbi:nuclease-related domain-containing protein [Cryobacterium sp. PAMC25264]|uniref:nuclease-related domain-containing protein n=1 Tax=Cryobacterium sp. PAMC25264 TaxID=2861288 RepID=UPI001C62DD70|nr:nuclease-related domain-containing protein [Cryobacterium sp. PAMC25264]QYF72338.1 NERD domain-containing protein [Cryobacterium sp. PAMC25264]
MAMVLNSQTSDDVAPSPRPGMIRLNEEARPWYTGAIGERRVGKLLAELGPDWTVLHSVPVGSGTSDIDHVVIGQPGVFTINTKHHPGKSVWIGGKGMLVGGHKVPYIRNAVHEAARAATLLSAASGMTVPVTSIITLVDVSNVVTKSPPDGGVVELHIVTERQLLQTLTTRPVLSIEQVQRIVDVAALPATWRKKPQPYQDGVAINTAFEALHDGVAVMDAHIRRRAYWFGLAKRLVPVLVPFLAATIIYWSFGR